MISPCYKLVPTLHSSKKRGREKRGEHRDIGPDKRERENRNLSQEITRTVLMEKREGVGIGPPVIKSRIEGTRPWLGTREGERDCFSNLE